MKQVDFSPKFRVCQLCSPRTGILSTHAEIMQFFILHIFCLLHHASASFKLEYFSPNFTKCIKHPSPSCVFVHLIYMPKQPHDL